MQFTFTLELGEMMSLMFFIFLIIAVLMALLIDKAIRHWSRNRDQEKLNRWQPRG